MRPQPFEDLNLAIRSFGTSPTLYASLEEALAAFLEPEVTLTLTLTLTLTRTRTRTRTRTEPEPEPEP